MATPKEQLEALGVTDSLKRVENPLATGWEEGAGGENKGKCDAAGWGLITTNVAPGAARTVATNVSTGGLFKWEIPVLPNQGQAVEVGFESFRIFLYRNEAATAQIWFIDNVSGVVDSSGTTSVAALDIFGCYWAAATGAATLYRKPSAGSFTEAKTVVVRKPEGSLKGQIFINPEGVEGTLGRVANVAFGALSASAAAQQTSVISLCQPLAGPSSSHVIGA